MEDGHKQWPPPNSSCQIVDFIFSFPVWEAAAVCGGLVGLGGGKVGGGSSADQRNARQ